MTSEVWRPVHDSPGYEVSDLGQVRSVPRVVVRGDGSRQTLPGQMIRPTALPSGRRRVTLGGRTRRYVAHLVLENHVGPRPPGYVACHGPGGIGDDRVDNLRWDTQGANLRDRRRDGTDPQVNRERCPWEHLLRAPNLRVADALKGHRACLACHRARACAQPGEDLTVTRARADRRYELIITEDR